MTYLRVIFVFAASLALANSLPASSEIVVTYTSTSIITNEVAITASSSPTFTTSALMTETSLITTTMPEEQLTSTTETESHSFRAETIPVTTTSLVTGSSTRIPIQPIVPATKITEFVTTITLRNPAIILEEQKPVKEEVPEQTSLSTPPLPPITTPDGLRSETLLAERTTEMVESATQVENVGDPPALANATVAFNCSGRRYGVFLDTLHNCKQAHVCLPGLIRIFTGGITLRCPDYAVFDQETKSCVRADVALPCLRSPLFSKLTKKLTDTIQSIVKPMKKVFEPLSPFWKVSALNNTFRFPFGTTKLHTPRLDFEQVMMKLGITELKKKLGFSESGWSGDAPNDEPFNNSTEIPETSGSNSWLIDFGNFFNKTKPYNLVINWDGYLTPAFWQRMSDRKNKLAQFLGIKDNPTTKPNVNNDEVTAEITETTTFVP